MPENGHEYCDVSLPVPMNRAFTYRLPVTLRHRVKPGCRLIVPFGSRKLTGMALACHDNPPEMEAREALRLLDEEPVLDGELMKLAQWIAGYYSAPLGEVLRSMTPLAGEIRRGKLYSLTDTGRDAARQLLLGASSEEPSVEIMRMLEPRPLTASWLARKVPNANRAIKSLLKKGFIEIEDVQAERDPLRSSSARLRVEFSGRPTDVKLKKAERELVAYLELYPGSHNLGQLEEKVRNASKAARSMARRGLLNLVLEGPVVRPEPERPPHILNPHQQEAFERIQTAIESARFQTFLLHGITSSGKTEVYLRAIESTLATGRGALLMVPEIALTPAVAGQFYHRFGDRVAILHSAFGDRERAEQWRRIRSGDAGVVVGNALVRLRARA